jgi:hypothetical protein
LTLAFTGARPKPALDESSFQQLLAAAYVVQQHNDGAHEKDPAQAMSSVLSEIAEIQSLVRAGGLDLSAAAHLTADRLRKITGADAAVIALMTGGSLECLAQTGIAAGSNGNGLASHPVVPTERLKSGEVFQSSNAESDIRLDQALCRHAGIGSLIAAPIHQFDEFGGVIEVRWAQMNAFQESDTRATRLMAGLIGGLLERNARAAQRRDSQLTPSDVEIALATPDRRDDQVPNGAPAKSDAGAELRILPAGTDDQVYAATEPAEVEAGNLPAECRVCGRTFGPDEAFCGQCSMPRVAGTSSEDLQSKWASLWYMQRAQKTQQQESPPSFANLATQASPAVPENNQTIPIPAEPVPQGPAKPAVRVWHVPEGGTERESSNSSGLSHPFKTTLSDERSFFIEAENNLSNSRFAPAIDSLAPTAGSAYEAEGATPDLLQSTWQAVWARMHRRHATWALSAVGLLLVFLMLAVWPSSTNSQLTWFQSVLVELGLAEVPAHPPVLSGNPDVRVWVDVHTALYYCPGSDLYGKTPGGHFASQHDAQVDEFEPASRVACP